jgi:hypothetical protein
MHRRKGNPLTSFATYSSLERKILGTVTIPFLRISTLKKFKYEKVPKMQIKPDPALLRTSYLSNEIKKVCIPKSHETTPLINSLRHTGTNLHLG